MIARDYISEWRTVVPWVQDLQVEQDLVISRALVEIFSHKLLRDALAFRGGTALYKLHLKPAARYSEDIDLVQTRAEAAGPTFHVDKNFPVLMRDPKSATGTELVEIQANQFASELLMPRKLIEQELAGKKFDIDDQGPIEELAKRFRVSRQALEYRIRNRD